LPAFGPVDVRGGVDGFAEPEEPWAGRPWFAESPPARGPDPDSRVSAARFAP
jgi:hypothetical protein